MNTTHTENIINNAAPMAHALRALTATNPNTPLDLLLTPHIIRDTILRNDTLTTLIPDPTVLRDFADAVTRENITARVATTSTALLTATVARFVVMANDPTTIGIGMARTLGDVAPRAVATTLCAILGIDTSHTDTVLNMLTTGDIGPVAVVIAKALPEGMDSDAVRAVTDQARALHGPNADVSLASIGIANASDRLLGETVGGDASPHRMVTGYMRAGILGAFSVVVAETVPA